MELHSNARVLPSNAPVMPENASGLLSTPTDLAETLSPEICQSYNHSDSPACSLPHGHPATDCDYGILRVSSGNVGSSIHQSRNADSKAGNTQEYEFRPVTSFVSPPNHSAQAAIKAEHPRRRKHSTWSSPKGLPMYWHAEWETPRYRAYRQKVRLKGSKDEIWPDRVEEAFQIAHRIFRRRGRELKDLHGKRSGCNEFIADFIEKTTGVERTRKQVSSHIQVLNGFLAENKAWKSLVTDIKPEKLNEKEHGSTADEMAAGGYKNSEYNDASDYRPSLAPNGPFPNRPPAPPEILASNAYPSPTIRRVLEFAMTLKEKAGGKALRHTYTSIQSETASAPKALADVKNWREMYPLLAAYDDRGQIGCPVFLFDTQLCLMDRICPLDFEINFFMDFSQGTQFTEWRSYPRFYEQNGSPVDLTEFYPNSESSDTLHSSQVIGTDNSRLGQIPFRSRWWVRVFSNMIRKKERAERYGDPELIREEEERAIQYVQGISVMLEIWATHRANNRPQRMAILLWKFSTARQGEAATTSWRRLLSAYEIQSPHPPSENPPMTLDTTFQAATLYDAHYIAQPSIFSAYPTEGLLTVPLSEDSSPSTTPTPESRSFPSSISTSFPPSVSNSTYPLYPSQESSFHLQDSAYSNVGSFDSQDPGYSLYEHHETLKTSHESYGSQEFADSSQESYGCQEVIYHSQNTLYEDAPDQLYEYQYQIVDAPVMASTSQDFTGGQINLSYAQTEDSQSPYEAPLIAPQANMVPQHQLIQHPEHFDQHDYLDQIPDDISGGHDQVGEQAHEEPLAQAYELNGLAIDYSSWEETLRLNPDLERHISINAADEVRQIEEQYVELESTQGEVLGEIQGEGGIPERQLEYQ